MEVVWTCFSETNIWKLRSRVTVHVEAPRGSGAAPAALPVPGRGGLACSQGWGDSAEALGRPPPLTPNAAPRAQASIPGALAGPSLTYLLPAVLQQPGQLSLPARCAHGGSPRNLPQRPPCAESGHFPSLPAWGCPVRQSCSPFICFRGLRSIPCGFPPRRVSLSSMFRVIIM